MKGSKGPENCTNEREAQALSTFTTQICPVTVKSSDSQRSRASASLGLLERTVWGAAPPRSAGLQSRAVTLRGRGEPHRGACWNAQCGVRPRLWKPPSARGADAAGSKPGFETHWARGR